MSKYIKCQNCQGQGYLVIPNVSIKRCECCLGKGVASTVEVMAWEWSL